MENFQKPIPTTVKEQTANDIHKQLAERQAITASYTTVTIESGANRASARSTGVTESVLMIRRHTSRDEVNNVTLDPLEHHIAITSE